MISQYNHALELLTAALNEIFRMSSHKRYGLITLPFGSPVFNRIAPPGEDALLFN